ATWPESITNSPSTGLSTWLTTSPAANVRSVPCVMNHSSSWRGACPLVLCAARRSIRSGGIRGGGSYNETRRPSAFYARPSHNISKAHDGGRSRSLRACRKLGPFPARGHEVGDGDRGGRRCSRQRLRLPPERGHADHGVRSSRHLPSRVGERT